MNNHEKENKQNKINKPILKWVEDLNRQLSKEDIKMVRRQRKRMFNVTNHYGNANPNHNMADITSYLSEWFLYNEQQKTSVGKNLEKRNPLCTIGGNVIGAVTMENSMKVSQKIKNDHMIQQSHFWRNENTNLKRYTHPYISPAFPGCASDKDYACQCRRHEMWVWSLG